MILLTGSFNTLPARAQGFTLIEVLTSLMILSLGVVAIFKVFFFSLDQLALLTHRTYMTHEMDNKIIEVERMFRAYQALPLELEQQNEIDVGPKKLTYDQALSVQEVKEFLNVFQVDLSMTWQENRGPITITRSAFITDFLSHE